MPSVPVHQVISSSNPYVNALLWEGWRWNDNAPGTNITFYFAPSGTDLTDTFNNTVTDSLAWQPHERTAYQNALQLWANVANITFTQVSSYEQADLVEFIFNNANAPALGIHETPQHAELTDGTAWGVYNRGGEGFTQSGLGSGGYGFVTLVHEIGHALGLSHPHDGGGDGVGLFPGVSSGNQDQGDNNLNQSIFTVMSYVDGWTDLGWSPSYNYGWVSGPMAFDIAAIQALYGANTTFNSGTNTYTLGAGNGSLSCIWDNGGTDTIAYGGDDDVTIDLRAATLANEVGGGGFVSYVHGAPQSDSDHWSAFTIANTVVIENAIGGSGDDTFFLSSEDVNNHIEGGEGTDTVYVPYALSDNPWYSSGPPTGWTIPLASTESNLNISWWAGSDILENVEYVHFADGAIVDTYSLALDFHYYSTAAASVSISDVTISEGNTGTRLATFTVSRTGGMQAFDIDFATADGSATAVNGDYVAKSGTLHFDAGVTTQTISVEIKGDSNLELDESFALALTGAPKGVTFSDKEATATITNDDLALRAEIEVTGNTVSIADGDTTPQAADFTDFGRPYDGNYRMVLRVCGCAACAQARDGDAPATGNSPEPDAVVQGARVIHTFTVTNTGGSTLTTSSLKLPKGFILIEGLSSSIAAGASDTFQVMMDTSTLGKKAGQISFTTSDIDERAFNFSVSGTVNPLLVSGNNGDNTFHAIEIAELFVGHDGSDTVSHAAATAGVTASLIRPSGNSGFAANDSYISIENLTGSAFNDKLTGDNGDNVLEGGAGKDAMDGGNGIDTASYAKSAAGVTVDMTNPSAGTGDAAGDTFKSIEKLVGSNHADRLTGGKLADTIEGLDGDDEIVGGLGPDILAGGQGADTFKYVGLKDGGDTILDFASGEDQIAISKIGFRRAADIAFGTGNDLDFAQHHFVSNAAGTATETGHGQFVFNQTTDELLWDADGTGAGAATLLVRFKGDVKLLATDFDLL